MSSDTDIQIAREITAPGALVQYLDGAEIMRTATALGVDGVQIRFGAAEDQSRPDQRPVTITWWWSK